MKTSFQCAQNNSSVAAFKAWAKGLSDALTAVGFNKTADSGQVVWDNVVAVPSINTYAGYEIRTLSDSQASALPIVMKIEYGTAGSSTYPRIQITVGRSTDGAGNLTGIFLDPILLYGQQNSNTVDCYVSCGEGYVSFAMWCGNPWAVGFYIARTCNPTTGVPNSDAFHMVYDGGSGGIGQQALAKDGGRIPYLKLASPCCAAPTLGSGTMGSDVGIYPVFHFLGYPYAPDFVGAAYFVADISTAGLLINTVINGQNRTLVNVQGSNASAANRLNGNNGQIGSIMVRYE